MLIQSLYVYYIIFFAPMDFFLAYEQNILE